MSFLKNIFNPDKKTPEKKDENEQTKKAQEALNKAETLVDNTKDSPKNIETKEIFNAEEEEKKKSQEALNNSEDITPEKE